MRELQPADEAFLDEVFQEAQKARAKFPGPNPTVAALTEEVGELAQCSTSARRKAPTGGKSTRRPCRLRWMAMRCASEGDETIGAVPTEENCQ